jgi:putative oxidoreductase
VLRVVVQRLFSTFANGLPGLGLLLQRLVAGCVLIQCALVQLGTPGGFASLLPQVTDLTAGVLLLLGLWTPVAGAVIAILQVWAFVSNTPDPRIPILLAMSGVSVALIGPGSWSLDARIFGRKQISIPQRRTAKST